MIVETAVTAAPGDAAAVAAETAMTVIGDTSAVTAVTAVTDAAAADAHPERAVMSRQSQRLATTKTYYGQTAPLPAQEGHAWLSAGIVTRWQLTPVLVMNENGRVIPPPERRHHPAPDFLAGARSL